MLRLAFRAVHANIGAYLLFLAFDLPVTAAALLLNEYYLQPQEEALGERVMGLIVTGEGVVQIVVYAMAACLAFTWLAREIDKPLWKIGGPRDAFSRFFSFWLLIGMVCLALIRFGSMFIQRGDDGLGYALVMAGQIVLIMVIPFGAIVTFIGNARGEDLRAAFQILPRVIDRVFLAMLIGFFQVSLVSNLFLAEDLPVYFKPLIAAADVYFDCVIFCYVFLACREQRESEEDDPYDL